MPWEGGGAACPSTHSSEVAELEHKNLDRGLRVFPIEGKHAGRELWLYSQPACDPVSLAGILGGKSLSFSAPVSFSVKRISVKPTSPVYYEH